MSGASTWEMTYDASSSHSDSIIYSAITCQNLGYDIADTLCLVDLITWCLFIALHAGRAEVGGSRPRARRSKRPVRQDRLPGPRARSDGRSKH